jgi:hypothetical protein
MRNVNLINKKEIRDLILNDDGKTNNAENIKNNIVDEHSNNGKTNDFIDDDNHQFETSKIKILLIYLSLLFLLYLFKIVFKTNCL